MAAQSVCFQIRKLNQRVLGVVLDAFFQLVGLHPGGKVRRQQTQVPVFKLPLDVVQHDTVWVPPRVAHSLDGVEAGDGSRSNKPRKVRVVVHSPQRRQPVAQILMQALDHALAVAPGVHHHKSGAALDAVFRPALFQNRGVLPRRLGRAHIHDVHQRFPVPVPLGRVELPLAFQHAHGGKGVPAMVAARYVVAQNVKGFRVSAVLVLHRHQTPGFPYYVVPHDGVFRAARAMAVALPVELLRRQPLAQHLVVAHFFHPAQHRHLPGDGESKGTAALHHFLPDGFIHTVALVLLPGAGRDIVDLAVDVAWYAHAVGLVVQAVGAEHDLVEIGPVKRVFVLLGTFLCYHAAGVDASVNVHDELRPVDGGDGKFIFPVGDPLPMRRQQRHVPLPPGVCLGGQRGRLRLCRCVVAGHFTGPQDALVALVRNEAARLAVASAGEGEGLPVSRHVAFRHAVHQGVFIFRPLALAD